MTKELTDAIRSAGFDWCDKISEVEGIPDTQRKGFFYSQSEITNGSNIFRNDSKQVIAVVKNVFTVYMFENKKAINLDTFITSVNRAIREAINVEVEDVSKISIDGFQSFDNDKFYIRSATISMTKILR